MNHKRVTVLRGGPSEEHEVSMRSGANVLQSLSKKYDSVSDVVITKKGEWLLNGLVKTPDSILSSTDVVFLALHGQYGEDGEVQKLLQRHNIPFTGSRSLPSAVAFNKHLTKETLKSYGVLMPGHRVASNLDLDNIGDLVAEITSSFGPEYVIKPVASGSSVGIKLVREGQSLETSLREVLEAESQVIVEEFIRGKEATCAALEKFRDEDVYIFPSIEIIPPVTSDFFTCEAKYNGETKELCPGNFSYGEKSKLAEVTALVHKALGLSQYSRSDFMIKDGNVYFLEVNTLPGLTSESLYPKAALSVGLDFDSLIEYLTETATT